MGAAGEGWRRLARWAAVWGAVGGLLPCMASAQTPASRSAAANAGAACAGCPRTLYEHYEATPMARARGAAVEGLMEWSITPVRYAWDFKHVARDSARS